MHSPAPSGGIPLGAIPALVIVAMLVGGAIVGLVIDSLRPGAITGGAFGLDGWRDALTDREFARAVWFTTKVSVITTALATIGALTLAVGLRSRPRWLLGAIALPIPVPHLAVATVAVAWLAPGGLVERIIGTLPFMVIGDRHGIGIIVVYLYKEIPFLTLLTLASWDQCTIELEHVAATLGASRLWRLRDVVWPRIGSPLVAGALVVGAFTLGATEVPLLVGPTHPDTIATYALTTVRINGPAGRATAAAALVTVVVLMLVCAALAAFVHRQLRRRR
ncbi:MAG: ABC transporter permease subunit [Acidimicrobiales bacterium]